MIFLSLPGVIHLISSLTIRIDHEFDDTDL